MKKNKTMRLASALLVLAILTTCALSATFAKYTSTGSGSATATVAKWAFNVSQDNIAKQQTFEFNLFDTIYDTGNTADETDVVDNLIAPGTSGSFALALTNASQVTAQYTVQFSEQNDENIPLQYSLDGNTWVDSIAALATDGLTDQNLALNKTDTKNVYWRWVFDNTDDQTTAHAGQTDVTDTALGIAAQTTAPTVTITATVTATQVD